MNKSRERNRKLARRPSFREPKPLLLIVCEGQVTEPRYFRGFANACANPRVRLEVVPAGVPYTVVVHAKDLKKENERNANRDGDENLKFDSVWAVFDVDDHPNLRQAIEMARDNKIHLAVSNPSFELWLLLHFRDHPGMKGRKEVSERLSEYLKDYDKHVDFSKLQMGYDDALKRARRLGDCDLIGCEPGPNPSTGVHRLTESIKG